MDERAPRRRLPEEVEAFTALFDLQARSIYGFCFRMTADQALAEDLMSITFLEAWRRRGVTLDTDRTRAWLFGIARNVVRNQRRSIRRHRAALARLERSEVEPDFADEVAAKLAHEEDAKAALATLRTIPRRERDIIALVAWSGLSIVEAAAALGIPEATARNRLFRARQRFDADGRAVAPEPGATEGVRNAR